MKMKSQKTEDFISRRKPESTHYVNTCTISSLERVLNAASACGVFSNIVKYTTEHSLAALFICLSLGATFDSEELQQRVLKTPYLCKTCICGR